MGPCGPPRWLSGCENCSVSEANVELVRRGYEAALRGDFSSIAELLDPEVKWHGGDPSARGSCHNRAEALAFMRNAWRRRDGRPGVGELLDVIDAGDQVVLITRPASVEDQSVPPVANLTTFRNGKVVEMVHYPNPDDALAAAGLGRG